MRDQPSRPTFAVVLVAEIGDVIRFSRPEKLCCWAGLTPRHPESDTTVLERSVRPMSVVVLGVLLQHYCEVARSGDQQVVEAFAAKGADEAFGDRVRSWCPDWGAEERMLAPSKTGSKAAVNFASRSRIKNRNWVARLPRYMSRLRACCVTQAPQQPRRCPEHGRRWRRHLRRFAPQDLRHDQSRPRGRRSAV
jgi:hypothetical protein